MLEVIATSLLDVEKICQSRADRIELCGGMEHGGTTPCFNLVRDACAISTLPIRVMIRNDVDSFSYSDSEISIMCYQISSLAKYDIEGFVFGCNDGDKINVEHLKKLICAASPKKVTYHRAFDEIKDRDHAIKNLEDAGVDTILTNFGYDVIDDKNIFEIAHYGSNRIFLIGGGVNDKNIEIINKFFPNIHIGSSARVGGDFKGEIDIIRINESYAKMMKKIV
jgi:copper homeostasis protein